MIYSNVYTKHLHLVAKVKVSRKSYTLITRLSWGENWATAERQSCLAGFTDFIHPLNSTQLSTFSPPHIINLSISIYHPRRKRKHNTTCYHFVLPHPWLRLPSLSLPILSPHLFTLKTYHHHLLLLHSILSFLASSYLILPFPKQLLLHLLHSEEVSFLPRYVYSQYTSCYNLSALLFVCLFVFYILNSLANGQVSKGSKPPAFTLKDQDGKTVSLSKYKGKPVVVYFYPADETPGCTKQVWRQKHSFTQCCIVFEFGLIQFLDNSILTSNENECFFKFCTINKCYYF